MTRLLHLLANFIPVAGMVSQQRDKTLRRRIDGTVERRG